MNLFQSTNLFRSAIKVLAFFITNLRTVLTEDVIVYQLDNPLIGLKGLWALPLLLQEIWAIAETKTQIEAGVPGSTVSSHFSHEAKAPK